LPNNPQNDAPMRFHFTDLPAEEGSVALMGARLSSAAPGVSYTFMLQVSTSIALTALVGADLF
jgi:hypothetical protein